MTWSIDARIPVVFAAESDVGADDAVLRLAEGACDEPVAAHPLGCACCVPRGAAAAALGRMFLERARGEVPFFRRVVCIGASAASERAVHDALGSDPVVSARFRAG